MILVFILEWVLETTVQGDMSECLILIQKLHERMVELECPSIISQVKFYHTSWYQLKR